MKCFGVSEGVLCPSRHIIGHFGDESFLVIEQRKLDNLIIDFSLDELWPGSPMCGREAPVLADSEVKVSLEKFILKSHSYFLLLCCTSVDMFPLKYCTSIICNYS